MKIGWKVRPIPRIRGELSDRKNPRVLFVGRLSPNKKQEDILKTFSVYQKYYQPAAALCLIGPQNFDSYTRRLEDLIRQLGINSVEMPGKVSDAALRAYYQTSDLFLCLSEHEGFCVPLMESFYFDLPVIAYRAAAVPKPWEERASWSMRKNL